MISRGRYSVPELRDAGDLEAWAAVFAETLKCHKNNSFDYMVDRTLYRIRFAMSLSRLFSSQEITSRRSRYF